MDDEPEVRLTIPAAARYLRIARLTVAGLAGDLGYSVDDIEDLRVAVDELSASIIDGTPPGTDLEITYREVDGGMVIDGSCAAPDERAPVLHAVARELLDMLTDGYSIERDGGQRRFHLLKRAPSNDASWA
jgi:serine/threonine-protein kinase RsbW